MSFDIHSEIKPYQVKIGKNLLETTFKGVDDSIFLCDSFFASRLAPVGRPVIAVDATEYAKSLDRMSEVIIRLRESGATRNTNLVAIGGGVIQDVATFCASIYMRGISWKYLPTTLLGMVDSCIGGKSAVNVGPYKNIVGNFYPPDEILIDPDLCGTLPIEQKVAGLCEAAKICYARGEDAFARYLALHPSADLENIDLSQLIELSLRSKKWFIEVDEFDRNERLLLNFGHTFGHAIEGAAKFAVSHGVAVGVGMLAAMHYARLAGNQAFPQTAITLATHIRGLLAHIDGLGAVLAGTTEQDLFDRFAADKKHTATAYTIVGIDQAGRLQRLALPRSPESENIIKETFRALRHPGFLSVAE
ncbi:MAG: 3-dehydroquinate synthase [Hydrogenophilales bacterium]|nr:3-dehydroquinate synthase [Hydrogenophilales bacterium]